MKAIAKYALGWMCCGLLCVASSAGSAPTDTAGDGGDHKSAVWKVREADFFYRSEIGIYDCGALKDRVASIFRAVGARDDMEIRVDDCRRIIVPQPALANPWQNDTRMLRTGVNERQLNEQTAHVRIKMLLPAEVTPAILEELQRDQSRRDLISHVTGNPAARMNNPVVFVAQRRAVTLSHHTIGLEPVECELLDQVSQVFRQLDIHVVSRGMSCNRRTPSRLSPELTVEALMPVPTDVRLPEIAPAEPQSETPPSQAPEPQRIAPASIG